MNLDSQEPLEALPMPDSAVELEVSSGIQTFRQMVIAALKQVLKDRRLALPLGPESALDDENRLVMLNRFAVQLAPAGLAADQINVDLEPWKQTNTAPQLLLAASSMTRTMSWHSQAFSQVRSSLIWQRAPTLPRRRW